ncbi:LytTR family DNA-binding domain-containing protein [Hydrogenophaga sp.]|uniref:LytR/AlgR family response regulator transcription factor n=1 Tax=Hydrogenophaga sp. TaxID=1904254 RepID=UPI002620F675|nr:LytTR family DNA-binding domain-containing protein [Hydrogenophaga sp.]MDM7950297.1 LytTR family DNA-binding domain-containing protein [Hydrogenophaga sp.]
MSPTPTALIAEDEPLLAAALRAELAQAWPALQLLGTVGDGAAAVREALAQAPDVLFLDIRMPGQTGLEAAADLADQWPEHRPFPALVFVTAYDQYAVQAFEAQAVDYLLKPVTPERLARTVARLQQRLQASRPAPQQLDEAMNQLRLLLAPAASAADPPLTVIQASVGNSIRMVPLSEVLVFEAADKYLRVLTAGHEYLIRTALRELLPRLDTAEFWQIHRGTVVRASAIDSVNRDEAGKLSLRLRQRPESLPVSRLYAQRFRAM